jgi:hypothetical protein
MLSELNEAIAKQKGVTVEALALQPKNAPVDKSDASITKPVEAAPVAPTSTDGVLSDDDLAKSYRSQADRLSKEAAQLRRQAEELVPTKKTSKKSAQSA